METILALASSISAAALTQRGFLVGLALTASITVLYYCLAIAYVLYVHPLSNLPGPKLWIAFPFMRHLAAIRGQLDAKLSEFHRKYGPVVRYEPWAVTFITAEAWRDIYGIRPGRAQLPKNVKYRENEAPDIIFSNDLDHARYRKALSHAFSEKGLRSQELLITKYVDLLVATLNKYAARGEPVDMAKWYNLTTFDLIGDLTFGESFNGLENEQENEWVTITFNSIKALPFLRAASLYPFLMRIYRLFFAVPFSGARNTHRDRTAESVQRRVRNDALHGRGDFMDSMLKHRGAKDGLSDSELVSNANILIGGGSETTASLLSGTTFLLLRNPSVLAKATAEIRSAFVTDSDITFTSTSTGLPYVHACLTEALRLYPPLAGADQRLVATPTTISGYRLPAGTAVAVPQLASYHSARNFHQPHAFRPERWLSSRPPEFHNDNRDVHRPFSVGPRNCIGQALANAEMRLILCKMLWTFDLELLPGQEEWMSSQKTYVIWHKGPLWVRLEPRAQFTHTPLTRPEPFASHQIHSSTDSRCLLPDI